MSPMGDSISQAAFDSILRAEDGFRHKWPQEPHHLFSSTLAAQAEKDCLGFQGLLPTSLPTVDMTYLNCRRLIFLLSCLDPVLPFHLCSWTHSCHSALTLCPDSRPFPSFVWLLIVSNTALRISYAPPLSGFWKLLNRLRPRAFSCHPVTYMYTDTHMQIYFLGVTGGVIWQLRLE